MAAVLSGWLLEYVKLLSVLLRPQVVLSLLVVLGAFWLARNQTGTTLLLLQLVIAVGGGAAGAAALDGYNRITGNTFLIKKSESAIRNLGLIKNKVLNAGLRIDAVRDDEKCRDWDEIANLVDNIGSDILNAINDWNDVNPESRQVADVLASIAQNEQAAEVLRRQLGDALDAKIAAEAQVATSAEETAKRDSGIAQLRAEIGRLQASTAALTKQTGYMLPVNASGTTFSSGGVKLVNGTIDLTRPPWPHEVVFTNQCLKCGKQVPIGTECDCEAAEG